MALPTKLAARVLVPAALTLAQCLITTLNLDGLGGLDTLETIVL
jgi:hypothetical protein